MDALKPRFRVQFNLRWLFAAITASALCALVYRLTGAFEAVVVAVALIVAGVCFAQRENWSRWIRGPMLGLAAIAVWMVGVDYSEFRVGCDHCHSHWHVGELRLFHQALWSRKERDHFPLWKTIAEDLGTPCPHDYQRWHTVRLWGLIKPGPPFINGTCCLSGRDWYDNETRTRVRSLTAADPALGEEFKQQVLIDHNRNYIRAFYDRIREQP